MIPTVAQVKAMDKAGILKTLVEGLSHRAFKTENLEEALIHLGQSTVWDAGNEHDFRVLRAAAAYFDGVLTGLNDTQAARQARAEFITCRGEAANREGGGRNAESA